MPFSPEFTDAVDKQIKDARSLQIAPLTVTLPPPVSPPATPTVPAIPTVGYADPTVPADVGLTDTFNTAAVTIVSNTQSKIADAAKAYSDALMALDAAGRKYQADIDAAVMAGNVALDAAKRAFIGLKDDGVSNSGGGLIGLIETEAAPAP